MHHPRPLRVLAVTNLWPTSVNQVRGIFVQEQIEALRGQGVHIDVEVVAQQRGKADYLLAARRVRRRARHYDLVHVHYGLTAFSAMLAGSVPRVLSYYGSDVNVPRQRAFSKLFSGGYRARIYVSRRLAVTAGDPAGDVIPCGVDFTLFSPVDRAAARAELGIEASEKVVMFGAHPDNPVKGYEVFTAVLEVLRERGLPIRELVLDAPSREAVPTWFAAADVLLFTSRQGSEGSPGVVKEAIAMGLPVVSVNVGDVHELLSEVSPSSVVDFSDSLVESLADQTAAILESGLRADGRSNATRLDWDNVATQIVDVYDRVLGKDSSR